MTREFVCRVATVAAVAVGIAATTGGAATAAPPTSPSAAQVSVIVAERQGAGSGPERAVAALGGSIGRRFGIIDAFAARVPAERLPALRATPGVQEVTEDAAVHLASTEVAGQVAQTGSLDSITRLVGATSAWSRGDTGRGVDVALIDSGVVPVNGLRTPGKVFYGPDLSLEAEQCDSPATAAEGAPRTGSTVRARNAMAGIIAGRDDAAPRRWGGTPARPTSSEWRRTRGSSRSGSPTPPAPRRLAGDRRHRLGGAHKEAHGLNIRVLNLSFGTDSVQDYRLDPLAYAAEAAWHTESWWSCRPATTVRTTGGWQTRPSTRTSSPSTRRRPGHEAVGRRRDPHLVEHRGRDPQPRSGGAGCGRGRPA